MIPLFARATKLPQEPSPQSTVARLLCDLDRVLQSIIYNPRLPRFRYLPATLRKC
jgi:hypothetical protein